MFDLSINTQEMERIAMKLTSDMGLIFGDMRDMFKGFDGELSEAFKKTFKKEGPGWKSLAESTQKARERRWGYYKKGGRKAGKDHPIGTWTGKMGRRAAGKGKAKRKSYVKDFGKKDDIRMRLEGFHRGNVKRKQPPRPIYEQRKVEKLLKIYAEEWYTGLTKAFEQFDNVDQMKRIAGRFAR